MLSLDGCLASRDLRQLGVMLRLTFFFSLSSTVRDAAATNGSTTFLTVFCFVAAAIVVVVSVVVVSVVSAIDISTIRHADPGSRLRVTAPAIRLVPV